MEIIDSADLIGLLTETFFKYGPFFISLLFTIYITRWAHKIYRNANIRVKPKATKKELDTYRNYFYATFVFGFILVIVSIVWWLNYQSSWHVYKGYISGLDDYAKIYSEELYIKQKLIVIDPNLPKVREDHFIRVQEQPLESNQKFKIYYNKGQVQDDSEPLELEYVPLDNPEFCIEFDEDQNKNIIKYKDKLGQISGNGNRGSIFSIFIETAYAQSLISSENFQQQIQIYQREINESSLVSMLQNERTSVGQKIELLDKLIGVDINNFRQYIEIATDKEPFILTLFDLSRHSDGELAYKARLLVNQKFNVYEYLVDMLQTAGSQREQVINILFRIEQERAEKIIRMIPSYNSNDQLTNLLADIQNGKRTKILFPMGSSRGDRYYVKAVWDYKNERVLNCLTRLFNNSLMIDRSINEELIIMKGDDGKRVDRYVYWYSKEWALNIAEKIDSCGGKSSFPDMRNLYNKK